MMVPRNSRYLFLSLLVWFSLAAYGCGGGGTGPKVAMAPPDDGSTAVLTSVPAIHGVDPIDGLAVQPGRSEEQGYVEISCPAGGPPCVISVTDEGSIEYETTGGKPSVMLRSLTTGEIEISLDGIQNNSNKEIFLFGGLVPVCLALHCPQGDTIYVRNTAEEVRLVVGKTGEIDTSNFEFFGQRDGVFLAKKEFQSQDQYAATDHRNLVGWLEHSMFVVSIQERQPIDGFETHYRYDWSSVGDSTGINVAAPPSGSATWSGTMAGIVIPYYPADANGRIAEQDAQFVAGNEGDFVSGNASVTIPSVSVHDYPSVNVEFSNIVNDRTGTRRNNMRWEGVEMVDGVFGAAGDFSSSRDAGFFPTVGGRIFEGEGTLFGQFYGSDHEEVGGLFMRDGIGGTFGARRDER